MYAATAVNRAWAVGGFPGYAEIPASYDLFHWDENGGDWKRDSKENVEDPYSYLQSVHFASENDGWAVAPYAALRHDGKNWREVRTHDLGPLSVNTLGGDEVWISSWRALYKFKPLKH
ncbi:MAG: hypothetical protein GTN49_00890 [candidate division Zixibacteria bacterium]|nr:hypothetical protein [candidate division Zixibacteria bacterium]